MMIVIMSGERNRLLTSEVSHTGLPIFRRPRKSGGGGGGGGLHQNVDFYDLSK